MNTIACCKSRFLLPMLTVIGLACALSTPAQAQQYALVAAFGSTGTGDGQFQTPTDIKFDSLGNIFVADSGNNRVEEFTHNGVFVSSFGTSGNGDGQLNKPQGLAIDSSNNIFVADTSNARVEQFSSTGVYMAQLGNSGPFGSRLSLPVGLAFDSNGNLFVSDASTQRIQQYLVSGNTFTAGNTIGSGQLNFPYRVTIDSNNNIYVADFDNGSSTASAGFVYKFSSTGTLLQTISYTDQNGQSMHPHSIAFDSLGNIFVTDFSRNRVLKFDSAGNYLTQFGTAGTGDGQFRNPDGIAIDSNNNIYVTDFGNNRVQVFAAAVPETGTLLMLAGMAAGGLYRIKRLKKTSRSASSVTTTDL